MSNRITEDHIKGIMSKATATVTHRVYGKACVVSVQLPNGFVITESSSCVNPEDYDEKKGLEFALAKVTDKVWELEGYKAHQYPSEIESADEAAQD